MINRKDFIESMDDTTINAGLIKFNIPEYDKRYETNGEEYGDMLIPMINRNITMIHTQAR